MKIFSAVNIFDLIRFDEAVLLIHERRMLPNDQRTSVHECV